MPDTLSASDDTGRSSTPTGLKPRSTPQRPTRLHLGRRASYRPPARQPSTVPHSTSRWCLLPLAPSARARPADHRLLYAVARHWGCMARWGIQSWHKVPSNCGHGESTSSRTGVRTTTSGTGAPPGRRRVGQPRAPAQVGSSLRDGDRRQHARGSLREPRYEASKASARRP